MSLPKLQYLFSALVFSMIVVAIGCGGSGSATGVRGTGTLAVHLSDGGGGDITAVNVTVTRIEAHLGSRWHTVFAGSRSLDLFDLRNADTLLGSALVPAGHYKQVRMFVSEATVTDSSGVHDVQIPSGLQTGIKINLDYEVDADVITDILLDFNVERSFILQGNGTYRLQPVIPAVVKVRSGTATGVAVDAAGAVGNATVKAIYTAGSNYALGTEVNGTYTQPDGVFKVWALLPGTYTITFSYVDPSSSAELTAAVTDVEIVANANTHIGTIQLQ